VTKVERFIISSLIIILLAAVAATELHSDPLAEQHGAANDDAAVKSDG
jgi:hypothetical protein